MTILTIITGKSILNLIPKMTPPVFLLSISFVFNTRFPPPVDVYNYSHSEISKIVSEYNYK